MRLQLNLSTRGMRGNLNVGVSATGRAIWTGGHSLQLKLVEVTTDDYPAQLAWVSLRSLTLDDEELRHLRALCFDWEQEQTRSDAERSETPRLPLLDEAPDDEGEWG